MSQREGAFVDTGSNGERLDPSKDHSRHLAVGRVDLCTTVYYAFLVDNLLMAEQYCSTSLHEAFLLHLKIDFSHAIRILQGSKREAFIGCVKEF